MDDHAVVVARRFRTRAANETRRHFKALYEQSAARWEAMANETFEERALREEQERLDYVAQCAARTMAKAMLMELQPVRPPEPVPLRRKSKRTGRPLVGKRAAQEKRAALCRAREAERESKRLAKRAAPTLPPLPY